MKETGQADLGFHFAEINEDYCSVAEAIEMNSKKPYAEGKDVRQVLKQVLDYEIANSQRPMPVSELDAVMEKIWSGANSSDFRIRQRDELVRRGMLDVDAQGSYATTVGGIVYCCEGRTDFLPKI